MSEIATMAASVLEPTVVSMSEAMCEVIDSVVRSSSPQKEASPPLEVNVSL